MRSEVFVMRFSSMPRRVIRSGGRCAVGVAVSVSLLLGSAPTFIYPSVAYADNLESAQAELERIGQEYNEIQSLLENAGTELENTKGQIEENQNAIAEKQQELEDAQAALSERVSTSYKNGNTNMLDVVLGATDFNDLISRIFYADKVVDADKQAIDSVKQIQEELNQKQSELETKLEEQQKLVDDTNAQLQQLSEKQQEAADLVNSLSAEEQQRLQEEASGNENLSGAIDAAGDANNGNISSDINPGGGNNNNNGGGNSGGGSSDNGGGSDKPSLPEASGGSPISIALQYQGAPYVYGGDSPSDGGFDCSGLVYYAYKQAYGISLPRTASAQMNYIKNNGTWTTNINELQYGDLVFFPGHVAFYVGNGNCYGARRPGVGASTTKMSYFGTFYGGGHL